MKAPPKKYPDGRGPIPGYTLVRAGAKQAIYRGKNAEGKPLWEFTLRKVPKGRPSRTLLCTTWTDAVSEAQKQVAEWKKPNEEAKLPAWTFSETIERYLAAKKDRGRANAGTQRVEAAWIRRVVEPFFVAELKDPAVDAVTEAQVRAWVAKYVEDGRSASTRHHRTRVLRALFAHAVKKGQRLTNPAEDFVVRPRLVRRGGDQRGHYPLSAAEMAVLQEWLDASAPPSVAFAIRLAAAVGCRDQELTHLRLEDVRLDAVTPLVHVAHFKCACGYCAKNRGGQRRTKTSHERLVPLPPELAAPFRDYLAARAEQVTGPWTFPCWSAIRSGRRIPGDQLGEGVLNDWLQKAVKAAKLAVDKERQRLVFHSLRAFAHTELTDRSHDYEAVCVALGHSLPGMGNRYSTLAEQPAKLAAALYPGAPRKGLAVVA